MKQYIKKALWIIPFVFSLNLSATDYEWVGGTSTNGSKLSNWEDPINMVPPSNFTTPGDVFNFAGAASSVDFNGMVIGEVIFKNSHPSINVTVYNSGTVWVASSVSPVFSNTMMTLNFSSAGTFIHTNPNISGYITSFSYYNLTVTRSNTLNTVLSINGTFTIDSAANYTISSGGVLTINGTFGGFSGSFYNNGTLNIYGSIDGFSGTIYHGTSGSLNIYSTASLSTNFGTISLDGGVWADSRSTKRYPGKWIYNEPSGSFIKAGTYDKIEIKKHSKLANNTTILVELILNTSAQRIELSGFTLTLSGIITGSSGTIRANTSTSYGSLIINTSGSNCGTVYFTASTTNPANILRDFTITNGASITLGSALNITGGSNYGTLVVNTNSTLNTGGFLTLMADADGSARIGESAGVISGEYTAETHIPATGRKYRFLASPVVGGTALEWRDNVGTSASRGLQITGNNGSTNGFDVSTTNNPSAFYYNEANAGSDTAISAGIDDAGWTAFSYGDGRTSLENGKGYRVLVRGGRQISLTANPAPTANATTIWVKGTYPGYSASSSSSQSIPITLSYTSSAGINKGINLVGNPYPSTIDWNAVTKGANVDAGYITYDPGVTGKGWIVASRYRAYNGSTGGAGRYISAGQGFLVYTSSNTTGNSITFEENDKVTNAGGGFFAEKLTNHLIVSFIYDSVYYDEAYLHFREDARDIRDRYDVVQFINPTVNVATIDSTGNSYNINSLGKLENKRSVFVNIANNPIFNYKIKFNDLGTFANHRIFLKDNFKKETIEIFEGNEYPISITADPLSNAKNRIELVFEPISASLKRISDNNIISLETNPVIEKLVLKNNKATEIGTAQINIINTTGQLIDTKTWETSNSDSFGYQTQKLSTGIYFIEIASKNYSQTIKFTKQ